MEIYNDMDNEFNYDILNLDKELGEDDNIYCTKDLWNFEDYFSI